MSKELVEKTFENIGCISRDSFPNTGSKNPMFRVHLKNCVQFFKSYFTEVQTN